jgi:hypothetical protein
MSSRTQKIRIKLVMLYMLNIRNASKIRDCTFIDAILSHRLFIEYVGFGHFYWRERYCARAVTIYVIIAKS